MNMIPKMLQTYHEMDDCNPTNMPIKNETNEQLQYEPENGELVDVLMWVTYPNYDFIFGIPNPSSPRFELEYGFIGMRKVDGLGRRGWQTYLDKEELENFIAGLQAMKNASMETRMQEWSKFFTEKSEYERRNSSK